MKSYVELEPDGGVQIAVYRSIRGSELGMLIEIPYAGSVIKIVEAT